MLPAGQTLKGVWAVPATGQTGVSFAPVLGLAPNGQVVTSATAECPGSAGDPKAAPGQLCVYVATGTVALFEPAGGTGALGFGVRETAAAPASGSWAVTAP